MPTLSLGVEDFPYPEEPQGRNKRGQFKRLGARRNMTTGRLTDILEDKYEIIQNFAALHGNEIAEAFMDDLEIQLGERFGGTRKRGTAQASKAVEKLFRQFIYGRLLDRLVEGVPTKASILGTSARPAFRKYPKGQPRPSFVDTGLYVSSFRAWVD